MHNEQAEQVVAQALQEVAARKTATSHSNWEQVWQWLLPGLVLMIMIVFLLAPGPLPEKLSLAVRGVCGLRPTHSYFAGPLQLPLEARLTGTYGSFVLAFVVLLGLGRFGAQRLGNKPTLGLLSLFVIVMIGDGLNSTLVEFGLPYVYTPTNVLRLLTGSGAGVALAAVLLWLLNTIALPKADEHRRPVIRAWWEVIGMLALPLAFAWLVIREYSTLYYPIALIGLAGVVGVLGIIAFLIILSVSRRTGQMTRYSQVIAPGALAVLMAFAVLGGTAALR